MAFPVSPTNNQTATVNGIVYLYSSADNAWTRFSSPPVNLTVTGNLTSNGNLIASNLSITNTGDVSANIGRLFLGNASTQANLGAYQIFANTNAATQATSINTINANLGAYQTYANGNATTQATSINTINANLGAYQTYANGNATTQATSINTINANLSAFYNYANTKIGTNTNSNLVVAATTASTSTTTGALVVRGGVGVAGDIISGGNIAGSYGTFISNLTIGTGSTQQDVLDLNNNNLYNVNTIRIYDPGASEGIVWEGGSGWSIYESPNDLSNNTGNLQIVLAGARAFTIDTNQTVDIPSTWPAKSTSSGALTVAGGVGVGGNLWVGGNLHIAGNTFVVNSTINNQVTGNLIVGTPITFPALNANVQYGGNQNNYLQLLIQNASNESSASTDFVAAADNAGSDTDTYIDMGINSSTYNQPGYTASYPNDGYLYVQGNTTTGGGNLILATMTNRDIVFTTGGQNTNNEVMRITSGNVVQIINNQSSTSTTTGALVVAGGAGISGNVSAGGLLVNNIGGGYFANVSAYGRAASGQQSWQFFVNPSIGGPSSWITFPDNTNQYTAYPGTATTLSNFDANIGAFQTYANTTFATVDANIGLASVNFDAFRAYANTKIGSNADGNLVTNGNVISNLYYSSGGASKFELTDIGLVTIDVASQQYKFGASGIESSPGIYGGTYGGNKLSLNNETALISNRYDTVTIQTGTDGSTQNTWTFGNNALAAPGRITALGNIVAGSGTTSTSKTTGALVVDGGAGVSGNVYVDRLYTTQGLFWAGNGFVISTGGGGGGSAAGDNGSLQFNDGGTFNGSTIIFDSASGNLVITDTTDSTSTTTGALVVQGGIGVVGNVTANKLYTTAGLFWSGNGIAFSSGGGGGSGLTYTSDTAPHGSPAIGDQWYDTSTDILYEYIEDGTTSYWVDVQSPIFNGSLSTNLVGNLSITGNLGIARAISATGNITTLANLNVLRSANIYGNILGGNIFVNRNATVASNLTVSGYTIAANIVSSGDITNTGNTTTSGNISANNISVTNTISTTNISTVNIATGNLSITGNVSGDLTLTGNVSADNLTVTDVISGNITATSNLAVTGNVLITGANVSLGNVANLHIDGGAVGEYLQTDGNGTVSWQSLPLTSIQEFTATGGQTVFTIVGVYTVGTVLVFVNGIQMNSVDYTATDGTTVVLSDARIAGDTVRVVSSVGASTLSSGLVLSVTNTKNFAVAMSIAMGM